MSEHHVVTEMPQPGVRLIRLNRPERRNALSTAVLAAVAAALTAADQDGDIRCLVLTGGPEVFAAGADIDELAEKDARGGLDDARVRHWTAIRGIRKPIVAAVNGWCLGAGNELLMCCDLAVAGRDARFGQPELNLGIIPGAGGTSLLPRLIGRARAMRLVLLGDALDAEEAKAAGLITDVVEPDEVLPAALALARRLADRAPLAIAEAKLSINAALETPLTLHHVLERQAFSITLGSADKREGVAAFREKRAAQWQGR
ncbi:enoyl-CoA hydratase-related protein [Zavarzinia compransoris]|uniref:2,3-dehydroadipyl-CoA hydratase n=1 Tax=Zavarzinia compransoris TaxID=1264899 RepID=A0A317DXS6_9PROT|nr:enoyl-CoA hydratase-related protein [Zavarzinia compransoris]PWR17625.1 2,3-dehydroadipyl-CoA hydratase [Zavarzinia compransoris]TDP44121.1 short chain enoyl-CoA hydratase [Zavarzinia compransoris]